MPKLSVSKNTEYENLKRHFFMPEIIRLNKRTAEKEKIRQMSAQETQIHIQSLRVQLTQLRKAPPETQNTDRIKQLQRRIEELDTHLKQLSTKKDKHRSTPVVKNDAYAYQHILPTIFENYVNHFVGAGKYQAIHGRINNDILNQHSKGLVDILLKSKEEVQTILLKLLPQAEDLRKFIRPLIEQQMPAIIANQRALVNFLENCTADLSALKKEFGLKLSPKDEARILKKIQSNLEDAKKELDFMLSKPEQYIHQKIEGILGNQQFSDMVHEQLKKEQSPLRLESERPPHVTWSWKRGEKTSTLTNVQQPGWQSANKDVLSLTNTKESTRPKRGLT